MKNNEVFGVFLQRLHKINPIVDLMTDGGSENKGMVEEFINKPETNMQKILAQVDVRFSNSMVEAVNKIMKYDFLFTQNLIYIEATDDYLDVAIPIYHTRPHTSHYGLTPEEVFEGMLPDKNLFKPAIKNAAKKRKEINLNQECLDCF